MDNTADEAVALARFLKTHHDSTVTVLTNTYHSRRTRFIFKTAMRDDAYRNLRFVTVPPDAYNARDWWRSEQGFATTTHEAIKLLAYWFLYGNAFAYCSVGIAASAVAVSGWLLWRRRRINSSGP